ncbi:chitinase [Streptomyces sp. NBC_01016]|uniref:chitinase n=1 Tax=Streptomyces sp. NBC_01016 TaxID=2903720 RepID=UPI0022504968|nr:chitinase [Streptomyces sp. NBC_01016]MCX4832237.1 chitinase [Streptomyces sp. NBC_01016]
MAPPSRGPAGKRRKPRTSPAAWLSARASAGTERTRAARAGRRTGAFVAGGAVLVAATVGGVLLATGGSTPTPSPGKSTSPSPKPSHSPPKKHTPKPKPKPTHSSAPPEPVSFAPYVDTSLSPTFDLTRAARGTGVKTYTLAFVKPKGDCTPQWGRSTLDGNPVAAKIGALRSAGGDVRVSFGGQSGNELARTCTSVSRLTSAYEDVIDHYKLTKVDFDIEGDALTDRASVDRRNRVVAALQRQHPGLDVSFTLPALPRGITADGLSLLRNAKGHGVDIGSVNAMAMNFGSSPAPHPRGRMGKYAIDAAEATHAQLKDIVGGSDRAVWNRVALTPMIGVNDIDEEVFTLSDAAELGAFAKSKGMAWVSLWSATRDRACPDGPGGPAAATCSGVSQSTDAFMKAFLSHMR